MANQTWNTKPIITHVTRIFEYSATHIFIFPFHLTKCLGLNACGWPSWRWPRHLRPSNKAETASCREEIRLKLFLHATRRSRQIKKISLNCWHEKFAKWKSRIPPKATTWVSMNCEYDWGLEVFYLFTTSILLSGIVSRHQKLGGAWRIGGQNWCMLIASTPEHSRNRSWLT